MDVQPTVLLKTLMQDMHGCDDELSLYRYNVLSGTILKKFVAPQRAASLHKEALDDFVVRNHQLGSTAFDDLQAHPIFRYWRDELHAVFSQGPLQGSSLSMEAAFMHGKCGPGASRDSESNDFVTKMFHSPLSTTSMDLYRDYLERCCGSLAMAEFVRYHDYGVSQLQGSKLTSVPKDANRNRVICIEPTLNMFYQLGVKVQIENLLVRHYRIDVSDQQVWNKHLARLGSSNGALATIDLRNASDSIHMDLVRLLLPRHTFDLLCKLRSPFAEVEGHGTVKLNMISTMGNGFTFPLMTIMFAALCRAFCNFYSTEYNKLQYGVFGDDIIIPTHLYEEFVCVLQYAGFEVNLDKSYSTGFFRESCGGDYYHGHNVRGVYLKELTNDQHIYSLFNRLQSWSLLHGCPLYNTLREVLSWSKLRPVPAGESFDAGHIIHSSCLLSAKRTRDGLLSYHCVTNEPKRFSARRFESNPRSIHIGYLVGTIRNERIATRVMRRRVVKKSTHNWDFSLDPGFARTRDFGWLSQMLLSY